MQLLGKVRESPGFLENARQAVAAYKNQIRMAEGAIQGLLASKQLQPGLKLAWNLRPDVKKANHCNPRVLYHHQTPLPNSHLLAL